MPNPWKEEERHIARVFGGKRIPVLGDSGMDVDAPGYAISVKKRKTLPQWLHLSVAQIRGCARSGQTPIVVLSELHKGRAPNHRYVVMALDDFMEWFV